MRKILLALSMLPIATALQAQVGGYSFSKSTAIYTPLPSTKTVAKSAWTFGFNNTVVSQGMDIHFFNLQTSNGQCRLTHMGQLIYDPYFTTGEFTISAMGSELYGVANSATAEISYVREGTHPNRILKVEYKGAGFYTEDPPRTSNTNFQIWLYEADDVVEFRYGPSSIQSSAAYPGDIGLFHTDIGTVINSIEVFGAPSSPTVAQGNLVDGQHINAIPAANTVYRFAPVPTNITTPEIEAFIKASFNPSDRTIGVMTGENLKATVCEVYNINGQLIASAQPSGQLFRIDASAFTSGIYLVKTTTDKGVSVKKFFVN
ncbi:MAG: T9SS type A sorting domain-containing protein [Sphingobacteriales bacterium]|nr:MAG: T9SS type A sorting domain-containing protein [Sphingobacteriales bacterium]